MVGGGGGGSDGGSDIVLSAIAFSNDRLRRIGEAVQVNDGTTLGIIEILPSHAFQWPINFSSNKICIVGTGSLFVEVEGQSFHINTNSAFKIRAGRDCRVENKSTTTTVLHVLNLTTIIVKTEMIDLTDDP
jgi:mannose-6-phosphate isomerase-like protein (cupin superfamily)